MINDWSFNMGGGTWWKVVNFRGQEDRPTRKVYAGWGFYKKKQLKWSAQHCDKRERVYKKKIDLSKISTRYPPPILNDQSLMYSNIHYQFPHSNNVLL